MNIAIVGYGKMGKIVETYVKERGHEVVIIISPCQKTRKQDLLDVDFDIVIEFSIPSVAMENMEFYAKHNIKVIMATTGWYDHKEAVESMFRKSQGAILWSGNFSIGVNLFWYILDNATKVINNFSNYDVFGTAFHHKTKVDSPSGTAIMTGNIILNNIDRKKVMITEDPHDRAIREDELHFSSTSGGNIPGIHSVYFDSQDDTIEITHSARTRNGFALGSVICAEWLKDKKGYFEIGDFMQEIIC